MRFTHVCFAALAATAFAAPANAATIVQNFAFGGGVPVNTINTFNSALGVLDSVVISGSGFGQTSLSRGPFPQPAVNNPASGGYSIDLGSPGNFIFSVAMTGATVFAENSPTGSCTISGSNSTTHTTNLGRFTDRGTLSLLYGSGSTCMGSSGTFFGSGTITFNYTPGATPVPEPATWAMMIGGFGLVGGAMRRKRQSRKAEAA